MWFFFCESMNDSDYFEIMKKDPAEWTFEEHEKVHVIEKLDTSNVIYSTLKNKVDSI